MMSQENVEIVRAATEAFNRGDLEAWLADADPEIEWHVLPEAPDPGPHRGRHVVLERARLWQETLAGFRAEVEEFILRSSSEAGTSENVELVYRAYDALRRQDLDTYVALHDPECEIVPRSA
jgi:ketosteroid isomerase-like protein